MHLRVAIEAQAARIYASVRHERPFTGGLVDVADCPIPTRMFEHAMRDSLYYSAARVLPKGGGGPPHPQRFCQGTSLTTRSASS